MPNQPVRPTSLILTRADVASLLDARDCRIAVEEAFRRHGAGTVAPPGMLGFHAEGGGFHIKVGTYGHGQETFFVAKTNANFPDNPARRRLPTVQGVIQVFDASSGVVVAILDSMEITVLRTAAATAVAASCLAREEAGTLTIAGCGTQGRAHARALAEIRAIRRVFLWDADPGAAQRLASDLSKHTAARCVVIGTLADGVRQSDMIVTCTPSTRYLLDSDWVAPGSFVAGVGADHPDKWELDPRLLARSAVVVDVLEQCAAIGDLHHALEAGAMRREDVYAELGEIVSGRKPGRTSSGEIFVFDSTGTAFQDAAAAVVVLERARQAGRGLRLDLGRADA